MCDLPSKDDWLPGTVLFIAGPLSFEIELADGRTVRRHCDHLRLRECAVSVQPHSGDGTEIPDSPPTPYPGPSEQAPLLSPSDVLLRRSGRASARPDRLLEHL